MAGDGFAVGKRFAQRAKAPGMFHALAGIVACAAVAGCGDGRKSPCADDVSCASTNASTNACHKDADCGDGRCGADGICIPGPTTFQVSQCAGVSCPAGQFCANGICLPATAQCKPPDPACIFVPHGSFEPPVHSWWWPWETPDGPDDRTGHDRFRAGIENPEFAQVMSTPVVMRLHPKDAAPAVVFNSFGVENSIIYVESPGVMRAINGNDGSPIWTAPKDFYSHMDQAVDGNASIAAGDCMGTGEVCFVTGGWDPDDAPPNVPASKAHQHGGLVAFGSDGRFLWKNKDMQVWWGGPAIARLLGPTGPAQIVVGNGVVDGATGKTLCHQTTNTSSGDQVGGNGDGTLTAIADIDLDGIPEIVTANQAYKLIADKSSPTGYTCRYVFKGPKGEERPVQLANPNASCPGGHDNVCGAGFPAVANFAGYGARMGLNPADPHPQIVVASRGYLRIHDWTGAVLVNPIPLPSDPTCIDATNGLPVPNEGGAPTIADFDGDGLPEVGIAAQSGYVVWKPGVGFLWTAKTEDCSGNTGSSVFDFEGKGEAKVVYADQCYARIYDGKTGKALIEEKNSSCTAYEMPIVADIDGTGRAKILVPANDVCEYTCPWGKQSSSRIVGLKALASPSDKWVNTRSVWNQHTYHVSNVNLDGTLPFPETPSWAPGQSNSYRQNVQGQGIFSAPDLVACQATVDMTNCVTSGAVVSVVVYNGGALKVKAGVAVTVYADTASDSYLVGSTTTKTALSPGASEKVTVPWPAPPQRQAATLRAVIDEKQLIGDCHPENNTTTVPNVICKPIG